MAAIRSLNMAFPFSSQGSVASISRSALFWIAISPLFGWAVFLLLSLKVEFIDRFVMLLFIFPFGAHLLLPLLLHAQKDVRRSMLTSPIRYYLVPLLLVGFMVLSSFYWLMPAAVLLALASGYHIGMQHFGLMRLIDRKLGTPFPIGLRAEKFIFLVSAVLPTAVFSLKIVRVWNSQLAVATIAIAGICAGLLLFHTFKMFRKVPPFRLVALWSFALMALPWAFHYRFDFNEGAFLVAGIGHSLQYFVCYRIYLSGEARRTSRSAAHLYAFFFLILAAVEWLAFENIQRNFFTSLIWALSAVHIYYDGLFWRNKSQTNVMQPLYSGLDRIVVK